MLAEDAERTRGHDEVAARWRAEGSDPGDPGFAGLFQREVRAEVMRIVRDRSGRGRTSSG